MTPDRTPKAGDLGLGKLLRLYAGLSVVFVLSLGLAAYASRATEWRAAQQRYNELAQANGLKPIPVGIKQIWKPELGVTDRCTSCHVAMHGAAPIPGEPLYAAHPSIAHDVRQFGCTLCHGGQGRATQAAAAHGNVRFWDEPMLSKPHFEAGCGSCHSHLKVPAIAEVERGRKIVDEQQCAACHAGERSLAAAGLSGFAADWNKGHAGKIEGEIVYIPLVDEETALVNQFLATQVGAPALMAGKLLAHRLGCRGCHRIGGVGGEEGADLATIGRRALSDVDFTGVEGPRTLPNWLREHFLDPARVVKDSQMPKADLTPEEAESLTLYMMSMRARPLPETYVPKDRVRVTRLGEREFPTDGESLYLAFCVGCHGPRGEGRKLPPFVAMMPGIGRKEFLAVADDVFLKKTITSGRPGRQMPLWGMLEGGLGANEIDALVGYLRSLQPEAPAFEAVMASIVEVEKGRAEFAKSCAVCHGDAAQGSMIAPPLAASDNLAVKSENAIYGTIVKGVAGTAMGAFRHFDAGTVRSLVDTVRAFPKLEDVRRDGWKPVPGNAERGASLFKSNCATCHGERGEGKDGPALANPAFLAAANDGYLAATIIRGRPEAAKAMPAFGTKGPENERLMPADVADVVAFLRTFGGSVAQK